MEVNDDQITDATRVGFNPICSLDHCGSACAFADKMVSKQFQSYLFVGSLWKNTSFLIELRIFLCFNPICSLDHCGS